jgi:DNA processing protein
VDSSIPSSRLALACVLVRSEGGSARTWGHHVLADPTSLPAAVEQVLEDRVPALEASLASQGWRWVWHGDASFPASLSALSDPPLGLFVRGRIPELPCAAVVGSRHASAYGREVAEHLGRELAGAGVCVASGMARGVDASAHRGALAGGGPTVAVWGTGPDRVYPREHAALAEEIAGSGALLTEYPPGTPPLPQHFPERNRLIAGLARVVVVVEADERSGALVTARLALDEGREVMAVPGSVFSRLSTGPNGLLRAGAAPVLSAADVLAALGVAPVRGSRDIEPAPLSALPAGESFGVERLAAASGKTVAEALELLLQLELDGWVVRQPDGRYRRNAARRRPPPDGS